MGAPGRSGKVRRTNAPLSYRTKTTMTAFVRRGLGILIAFAVTAVARGQSTQTIARHVPSAPDPAHVFVLDSAHLLSAGTIVALQDGDRR